MITRVRWLDLLEAVDGQLGEARLARVLRGAIILVRLGGHPRRVTPVVGLLVERRGSLIVLAPAVHFRRAIELPHALIGLGGLTVGAAMLVAACGVEIISRFFVDFRSSKRIATEEKLHRCLVSLVLLVKMLASHLCGAHTVAGLRVGVRGVIHRARTLIEVSGFHVTIELEEQPRCILPLFATLEHFRSLLVKSSALEGLPRKPAIFRELRMVRR